ncbi:proline racemase family protein [Halolamina salifodinae]|uniref:Proline racemase n=1 Tax=Halolamina salifodinae TaxID=1202767 RepID=A0A8T4GV24_9EURY|nr:proline racemase family protein [Halolamina salifodinae]MBP1986739.1 proline racemase [Halolamina salifodinae]
MKVDVNLETLPTEETFTTLDTHTAGEPTRILLDGFDPSTLEGESVRAKRDSFADRYDRVRELLLKEPRGHDNMFGAVLVEPHADDAALGVFFMDSKGYLDMCGHGTIGVVAALVKLGQLSSDQTIQVETPAGVVEAELQYADGGVEAVTIEMVDSFVYETVTVSVPFLDSPLEVDVVYAGNFFAMVDCQQLEGSLETARTAQFVEWGLAIREAINEELDIVHPFTDEQAQVSITEIYESGDDADRSIVVFGNGQVDRSPCGTGTCAKMALLHEAGKLSVGEPYAYESIIGTRFQGRLIDASEQNGITVTTPTITGSAWITGTHTFVKEPRDQMDGFTLYSADE